MKRQSPLLILGGGDGLTINTERINSQLSHWKFKDLTYFSCMLVLKLFTLLFTIDTERINSLCVRKGNHLCMWKGNHLFAWKGNCLCWSLGADWWSTQRINSQLSHVKFKRFNLFFLHVGIKTVTLLLTIDAERINSLWVWKGNHLCWSGGRIDDRCREDQQSTFTCGLGHTFLFVGLRYLPIWKKGKRIQRFIGKKWTSSAHLCIC